LKKIYIGTPTYSERIHHLQVQSLISSINSIASNGDKINYVTVPHTTIDVSRNLIVAKFLYTNFDYLVFIDDDIVFNPKDLINLISFPETYKVISGVYSRRGNNDNAHRFTHILKEESNRDVAEALYTGGGFLRIHKSVFSSLKEKSIPFKHPSVSDEEMKHLRAYFNPHFNANDSYVSEDVDFCNKCHEEGIKVFVDQSIRVGHSYEVIG